MSKRIDKTSDSHDEYRFNRHRPEHWHVDHQVYFITARCHDRFPAFADEQAKAIFWDRFNHYAAAHDFTPWVTSLLDNHYHTLGYLRTGSELPKMIQKIHGSVAKLVNDHLRASGIQAPWLTPQSAAEPPTQSAAERASARGALNALNALDALNASNALNPSTPSSKPPHPPRAKARSAAPKFFGDRRGQEYFDGCLRNPKQGRHTYRYVLHQPQRHGICTDYRTYPHTRIHIECERAIKRALELNAFLIGVPYPRYHRG